MSSLVRVTLVVRFVELSRPMARSFSPEQVDARLEGSFVDDVLPARASRPHDAQRHEE